MVESCFSSPGTKTEKFSVPVDKQEQIFVVTLALLRSWGSSKITEVESSCWASVVVGLSSSCSPLGNNGSARSPWPFNSTCGIALSLPTTTSGRIIKTISNSRHEKKGRGKVNSIVKHNSILATSMTRIGGYMSNRSLCVVSQKVMYTTVPTVREINVATKRDQDDTRFHVCTVRISGLRLSKAKLTVCWLTKVNTNVPQLGAIFVRTRRRRALAGFHWQIKHYYEEQSIDRLMYSIVFFFKNLTFPRNQVGLQTNGHESIHLYCESRVRSQKYTWQLVQSCPY